MGRVSVEIDKAILTSAIAEVDGPGPLATQSLMFAKVAEVYNRNKPASLPAIEPHIVKIRIDKWNININTLPGKRGRQGGIALSSEHKAKLQAGRKNGHKRMEKAANKEAMIALRKRTPIRLKVLVDRVEHGSLKAAVKLNCIACMGYDNAAHEIRHCTSKACAFWAFRPFQREGEDEATAPVDKVLDKSAA